MTRKLKIFLLSSQTHPEELATMGAEKDIIEQDVRFECVNPGDFPTFWKGLTEEAAQALNFRKDLAEILDCDGVLVMTPPNSGAGDLHDALYTISTMAGIPNSNNSGDLMHTLRRNPTLRLPVSATSPDERKGAFLRIGYADTASARAKLNGGSASLLMTVFREPDARYGCIEPVYAQLP